MRWSAAKASKFLTKPARVTLQTGQRGAGGSSSSSEAEDSEDMEGALPGGGEGLRTVQG